MKKLPKILLSLGMLSSSSFAADLFQITATAFVPPPPPAQASSSNALNLIESLVSNQAGAFSAFHGQEYFAQMTFLGTPNAISMAQSFGGLGYNFNLDLNPIGVQKLFTGPTENDVWAQVKKYFEDDVNGDYSRFLKALSKQSTTSLTDGNPRASTAIEAGRVFSTSGFSSPQSLSFGDEADGGDSTSRGRTANSDSSEQKSDGKNSSDGSSRPRFKTFGLGFNSGRFAAEVAGTTFRGQYTEVGFSWLDMNISDDISLQAPLSVNWLTLEGTDAYGLSQGFALPITLSRMDVVAPLNWRVTPVAGIGARVSTDALSGAVMWYAGASNSLDYRVNNKLVVSMVNQLTTHQGLPVSYKTYSFDSGVDQWIMKNGLRLTTPLAKRVIGDVYIVDTKFLKSAAVDHFESVGSSISWRATENYNLSLAGNYDFGDNFSAFSVGITSAWSW